jgi:hypothetical protein
MFQKIRTPIVFSYLNICLHFVFPMEQHFGSECNSETTIVLTCPSVKTFKKTLGSDFCVVGLCMH